MIPQPVFSSFPPTSFRMYDMASPYAYIRTRSINRRPQTRTMTSPLLYDIACKDTLITTLISPADFIFQMSFLRFDPGGLVQRNSVSFFFFFLEAHIFFLFFLFSSLALLYTHLKASNQAVDRWTRFLTIEIKSNLSGL